MAKKKNFLFLVYFLIFLEILLILSEFFLNLKGITLCQSSGCKILPYFTKIDKKYFLFIGLLYFLGLLIFFYLYNQTRGNLFRLILLSFLGGGFSAELTFSFRQLIEIDLLCSFCLIVAFLFFLIFIFSFSFIVSPFFLSEMFFFIGGTLTGFVFSFYLTTIDLTPLINSEKNFSLIYSENCPYCKEVIENFKNQNQTLNLIKISSAYPLIKKLNFNQVPILIHQKSEDCLEFFIGRDQILKFLNSLTSTETSKVTLKTSKKGISKSLSKGLSKKEIKNLEETCGNETEGVCEFK